MPGDIATMNDITTNTNNLPIEAKMSAILITMFAILVGMHTLQTPMATSGATTRKSCFQLKLPLLLPDPNKEPSKYCYEVFAWYYTAIWICFFGIIVASQSYEHFTAWGYLGVCGGLALPLLLQPLVYPLASTPVVKNKIIINPDGQRPFYRRYATKATIYLMTYAFIGNYWYTHYFYSVLKAEYTMPSHRLNNVPIAMFLATHFYFCTYHVCVSNGILRFVDKSYQKGCLKSILFWFTILFLSYFTAFMETLTISSFPYYSFFDRTMAYTWGSAFYGIYFIVSFPGFYYFDSHIDDGGKQKHGTEITLIGAFTTACGHGMMILTLLDFVRLYLEIPLVIGGVAFATTG
jgi:cycloeucalenol cycloisomerase